MHWDFASMEDLGAPLASQLACPQPLRGSHCLPASLHLAAQNGNVRELRQLIELGADVECASSSTGDTALLTAADNGHVEFLHGLLELGADTEKRNACGETALIVAASKGHTRCVCALLEYGANARAQTNPGRSSLVYAVLLGNEKCADELLAHGADENEADLKGVTVLSRAASALNTGSVRILLLRGADVKKRAHDGSTALHRLVRLGHHWQTRGGVIARRQLDIMQLLLQGGDGAVDSLDLDGRCALDYAAGVTHTSHAVLMFQLLVQNGANINRNAETTSALMILLRMAASEIDAPLVGAEDFLVLNTRRLCRLHIERILES
ncbi:Ankyrin repeat domain-containing protein 29 [Porphyridium purpureum]|uniref:Ankyrin repeat domain-containing protein 29 n=1 Tax=Porphyridium purpureum TaxID=35688 RepID=A0A5J4YWW2_PORPP|nr:Ankyrin repeat domain-containing protein 29 [Porphyridium purpureum]|eukprot:POR1208..scf227_4